MRLIKKLVECWRLNRLRKERYESRVYLGAAQVPEATPFDDSIIKMKKK
jgi:hypothetical protein